MKQVPRTLAESATPHSALVNATLVDSALVDPTVVPLSAFSDNYIWLLRHHKQALVVDPGQAAPVLRFLQAHRLQLQAILLTHHHHDHVGGVTELVATTHATVYGPATEPLPYCDVLLREGDRVTLPELDLVLDVLDVPGHTAGHIAYVGVAMPPTYHPATNHAIPSTHPSVLEHAAALTSPPTTRPAARLFCGDTLFAGGCGRLFEGTALQMHTSLGKLASLPPDTKVYCAHEYTLSNLRWALTINPNHLMLQQWYQRAQALQAQGLPTLPSSIGLERETNPFLRTQDPDLIQAVNMRMKLPPTSSPSSVEVFTLLRQWKDNWKEG